jgi:hypothetical protein
MAGVGPAEQLACFATVFGIEGIFSLYSWFRSSGDSSWQNPSKTQDSPPHSKEDVFNELQKN